MIMRIKEQQAAHLPESKFRAIVAHNVALTGGIQPAYNITKLHHHLAD
ncbi:hypothetical protein L0Z72_07940 [candidate division KSB1 bacterium]|nr:hypothetical protein [candidate division KSB1 bacterium]